MRLYCRKLCFPVNVSPERRCLKLPVILLLVFLFIISAPPIIGNGYASKTSKAKGVYHRVKKGETLSRISRAYRIPVKAIAEANRIKATTKVEYDSVLFIPGAKRVIDDTSAMALAQKDRTAKKDTARKQKAVEKGMPKKEAKPGEKAKKAEDRKDDLPEEEDPRQKVKTGSGKKGTDTTAAGKRSEDRKSRPEEEPGKDKPEAAAGRERREDDGQKKDRPQGVSRKKEDAGRDAKSAAPVTKTFLWPVKGRVVSRFGIQPDGMMHNGIRIASRPDRPVVAAARGTVIYSALLKDYGETIILKHEGSFATVYTNLGERLVNLDDRVRQGMKIGLVGRGAGKNEGTMSFEVRYKNKAVNPLRYLK